MAFAISLDSHVYLALKRYNQDAPTIQTVYFHRRAGAQPRIPGGGAVSRRHKLAAVMFTDIYGFYAVVDEDWRQALKLLQKNRQILTPLIKAHNGMWLQQIEDGQLSMFESAIDAVNCALEIQRTLWKETDLTLRIGIHFGYVVIAEGEIFGDGPNVACRIEPLAEPGGIYISKRVYDAVQDNPDINPIFVGRKKLINVKRLIKVYALAGEGLPFPRPIGDDQYLD